MSWLVPVRSVLAVHRLGSLTRAARELGLTQPAVTGHLKSVEAMVGRPLFRRNARGVEPLPAADELAAAIGPSLDRAEAAFAALRARAGGIGGTLRIAGPPEFMAARMGPVIAALAGSGMSVRLVLGGRRRILEALAEGQAEIAVLASRPDEVYDSSPITEERLLPVASTDWAQREGTTLAEAARHPPIAWDEDSAMIRAGLSAYGIVLPDGPPGVVAPDLRLVRALVLAGAGWTVLPDYLVADDLAGRRLRALAPPAKAAANRFHLVWPRAALREPRVAFARDRILAAFG